MKKETQKPLAVTTPAEHPFKAIRRAGVPLVAYETADPAATMTACRRSLNGKQVPVMQWDVCGGLRPVKTRVAEVDELSATLAQAIGDPLNTQNFPQCLSLMAENPPKDSVVFIHAANRVLEDWTAAQAVWNLRDKFKAIGSTLVLMGPAMKLPAELANDAPIFEEPAPTNADIERLTDSLIEDAQGKKPEGEERARIIEALTGYASIFAIEQSLALSIEKRADNGGNAYSVKRLWALKVASLKNTAGLTITQPSQTLADLAGCEGIKSDARDFLQGRKAFGGVFFLDELEKMVATGTQMDGGASSGIIEQFLGWTADNDVTAILLIGVPGGGKTFTAACIAGEMKGPLLRGSMSSVKGGIVGASEANMKTMLRAVDGVTNKRPLMIATCNSLGSLTPEILARFKMGVYFYDYPTETEAKSLWNQYRAKYELTDPIPPNVLNWVGREVDACCQRAWMLNVPLAKAAKAIVPVCRANGTAMEALRSSVSGRFLSASYPGTYTKPDKDTAPQGRKISE